MHVTTMVFIVLAQLSTAFGQADSTSASIRHNYWKAFCAPLFLTAAGLVAATDNEIFDKWEIRELSHQLAPNFRTHIDNYLVVVPIVAVYGLDIAGVQPRNDLLNQSLILIKAEVLVAVLTASLKKVTHSQRPDGTADDSFPSGHTSQAFMGATFLHKEFGQGRPWISILGFVTASGVGILRIMNDRHWISDVLVGAGIGILSGNIAYVTHKYRWGKHPTAHQARILPFYQEGCAGFYLTYTFAGR